MVLCAIGQVQNVLETMVGVIELVVGISELVKEYLHAVVRDWASSRWVKLLCASVGLLFPLTSHYECCSSRYVVLWVRRLII